MVGRQRQLDAVLGREMRQEDGRFGDEVRFLRPAEDHVGSAEGRAQEPCRGESVRRATTRSSLLKDAADEDVVVVSPVSFTTKDFVAPVVNTNAIVFSYPENGMTKVTAPPGSLPPFSEVLILNATNGAVLWLQVDGEGCIGCLGASNELPATINDRLMVTITDPQGNVTTFERSKFVKADGTVAIGPGGGTVEGAGGVELRIPSGALENGAELKVEGLTAETLLQQFPGQVPDLGRDADDKPVAKLAGGIKITSKDEPSFTKPVDLAFPLPDFTKAPEAERPPAGKPEDAYYYVVRRLEGPCADGSDTCAAADRKVLFQTIDHAFAECPEGKTTCEASEKKAVTASWPFSGYVDSFGGFGFVGSGFLIQAAATTYAYLLWTYDQALPGQALAGVVTGKVLRTKWNPGATTPQYEGVKGALVSAVDASGQRLLAGSEQSAITREDGSFTMWDSRYVGGTVRVAATLPGVGGDVATLCPPGDGGDASVRCGTAYEADPADWKTSGLRFHRNIATVNLTFPAIAPPPPPPAIGVVVYRVVDGQREDTRGIVPAGTPLILGVKPSSQAVEVREVQVQGAAQSFRSDPLKGQPTGADWIVEYTPGTVGTYRVEVTGLGASAEGTAEAVKGGTTFRVIGAGGTDEIVEGARPEVIPARTVPKSGASGVQVSTYMQVVFTEPVRKVSGNVLLKDAKGQPVAVKLSGVLRHGGVVEDLAASPDAVVTSLTVQPLSGLKYGATYRLELGDGIEDLDTTPCGPAPNQPPPCNLVPYDTQFTTFTPESLSKDPESFGSPGIVVLGERAYLVQNHFYAGTLRVFETADPVTPLEIPNSEADSRDPRYTVSYRPVDLVGETDSPLTGGRVVAVVTGPTAQSKPSNVWLLDVNDDAATQWIGAVSLTSSAQEGFVSRSFLRAGVLYAATFRKGIQVVDLGRVKDAFKPVETDATGHFQMRQAFLTDGQGYGQENVVGIPVSSPFGGPARLNDIEAALTQTADGAQVLVAAPGDPGLTVVNPNTQSVLWNDKVTVEREVAGQKVVEATLRYGQAIALGTVAGQDLAVVVGSGTIQQETQSRPLLMVVSLYDPQNPVGLGYVLLDDATVGDVILKDDLALLGGSKQVTLVSLTDPTRPKVLGTVSGVGGRLALGENGLILFGTAHSVFGGTDIPLGGIRTAALSRLLVVQPCVRSADNSTCMSQATIPYSQDLKTEIPIEIQYRIVPGDSPASAIRVRILASGPPQELAAPFDGTRGATTWPEGTPVVPTVPYFVQAVADEGLPEELVSRRIPLRISDVRLELTKERELFVAKEADGSTSIGNTWDESGSGIEPPINIYEYKHSTRTYTRAIAAAYSQAMRLPDDYVVLKLNAGGALVWEESGGQTLRLNVPDTALIEAKLKAVKEIAALSVERVTISVEYYPAAQSRTPLKLKDDYVLLMNERLHGLVSNAGAAAIGRGEGLDGAVVELGVGLIPFAGDAAGILGEVINGFDPSTDVSKANFALSIVGIATEFSQITGPIGVALDKAVVFLRIGLKRIEPFTTGPLKKVPGILYDAAKARNWDLLLHWAEGSMKLAMASGSLVARIAKTEIDLDILNRVMKRYSETPNGGTLERVLNKTFAEKLVRWDDVYADPEAVRGAVTALGGFADEAGNLIRLSDEASEGAVKFMARAGADIPVAEREELLRMILSGSTDEAEALLRIVRDAPDAKAVEGLASLFRQTPCVVP